MSVGLRNTDSAQLEALHHLFPAALSAGAAGHGTVDQTQMWGPREEAQGIWGLGGLDFKPWHPARWDRNPILLGQSSGLMSLLTGRDPSQAGGVLTSKYNIKKTQCPQRWLP